MKEFTSSLTALGVKRPVLIIVVNLLIMLGGIASIMGIDVRELPNVDRPVVSVRAVYDGASPKTMDTEVTSVIEGAIARVSGVRSIEAASEENNARFRIEFESSVNLDAAASDVREAVNRALPDLPDDIQELTVVKADDEARSIVQLAVVSNTLSKQALAKRVEKDVSPELLSIEGVADVRLNGNQPRVLRVLMDPARMAHHRISTSEVVSTLRNARMDVPAGSYESTDQELLVRAYASVVEPELVEKIHIRDTVRIEDIGVAFYAPEEAESYSMLNGRMVIGMGVIRQPGSNTIAISNEVDKRIKDINERVNDFEIYKTSDDSLFIEGSLKEVLFTLGFAVFIVLVVIALFLGQWRAILIPAVTIPISLVGSVAAIWLFGFSINLLTLLALVLATGLIVDDAIVVLENIQRRRSQGLGRMASAVLGTHQVFFAVIATTITLIAVFLPIAFLPGETGRLFREFGLVLAIAVTISSFVALTLCPMMASRLPDLSDENPYIVKIRGYLNEFGRKISGIYFSSLKGFLSRPLLSLGLALLIAGAGVVGFMKINHELLPSEDRGELRVMLTGPDGASLQYSDRQARKLEAILQPYREKGVIEDIYTVVGQWDKNRTLVTATLKPWGQRNISQIQLEQEVNEKLESIPGSQVRILSGNSLNVRGASGGLELALTGNEYEDIYQAAVDLSDEIRERVPLIQDIRIQYDTSQPELSFNIDRERAHDLNIPIEEISQTLRVMVDRFDVVDLNIEDEAVTLYMGSTKGAVNDPGDLLNIFVINEDREPIPLSSVINLTEEGVAAELDRHAQRRAIEIDLGLPPGASLGNALQEVRTVARDVLPGNVNILFLGEAATLEETSYEVAMTFIIAFLVVFLVLAAQFESFGNAVIIIFTVPFGLAAAVFAILFTGQTINLYSQIGFVMLIGLMAKNAILLMEFMNQVRDEGKNVPDAIMEGVHVRLRPVIMTVLSTVLGSLPLILSEGPGAEARRAIGWVIFGGLGLSTVFTLYLTPLGYSLIAPYIKPRTHSGKQLEEELEKAENENTGGDRII